jgi:O-antigen ligase
MNPNAQPSEGRLLALLSAGFYALFTLLPDSHSLMVQWPWVLVWQLGLLCPVLWLLGSLWHQQRIQALAYGCDSWVGLSAIAIVVSTLWAEFPQQARWYGWAALCFIAALYALNTWLTSPQRRLQILVGQGYLSLAFIVLSLSLWTTQTLLPELARLAALNQSGVQLPFDFSVLELRNWAPIGHQNYVAGYLLLALPLLIGLCLLQRGWRRWLWIGGIGLGILDLYTTSSRGGWLGLVVLCLVSFAILLFRTQLPRRWLGVAGASICLTLVLLVWANNRLRTVLEAAIQGQGDTEFAYRTINAAVGWQMGSSHPWSGIGLGNVPLLYQKYRPLWAGQESELAYQLHSTPVQLWAEMGIGGILLLVGAIAFLLYRLRGWLALKPNRSDRVLVWSLCGGLLAYGVLSLTDYQLDNVSISGTLVIYVACLASAFRIDDRANFLTPLPYARPLFYAGLGILLGVIVWLVPIHRAWQLSSQGFEALAQDQVAIFRDRLVQAHQTVPWEPYYPYQLAWNFGNFALQSQNSQQRQLALEEGIRWFKAGLAASPYQEFGSSNLGWLLLENDAKAASGAFARSARLVPAKRGVMYGLGLSLLAQGKLDWAIEAMALESLRDPAFVTSPRWRLPQLRSLYPQVLDRAAAYYTDLLQQHSQPRAFNAYLHNCRGSLYWWQGKLSEARADLDKYGNPLSRLLLDLAEGKSLQPLLSQLPASPSKRLLEAWANPSQRPELLRQAWILAMKADLPPETEKALLASMDSSTDFEQWLKQNAPVWEYRRQRSGFGVLSRHVDGPLPTDLWTVVENLAVTTWLGDLFPSPVYYPDLDLALQPRRDTLTQVASTARRK